MRVARTPFSPRLGRALGLVVRSRTFIRYGLVCLNLILLSSIGLFVFRSSTGSPLAMQSVHQSGQSTATLPLDQLSSADIAVNASVAAGLPETTAVVNQADSAKADLAVAPAASTVVAKPQAVNTALKSRKDIQEYIVQDGDTVTSIAGKFGITSDSVRWSNDLSGDQVKVGAKLLIPPINGIAYVVKSGDTLDSLASKYRASKDQLIAYNDAEINGIQVGEPIIIPNGQMPAPVISYVSYLGVTPQFAVGAGYNGYDFGFCTYYAAEHRKELGNPVPANLGNANTWASRAASFNMSVGSTPKSGAVAVLKPGTPEYIYPGHVTVVEVVNDDGSFWISEMNDYGQKSMTDTRPAGGWGSVDWRLIPAGAVSHYDYIY